MDLMIEHALCLPRDGQDRLNRQKRELPCKTAHSTSYLMRVAEQCSCQLHSLRFGEYGNDCDLKHRQTQHCVVDTNVDIADHSVFVPILDRSQRRELAA